MSIQIIIFILFRSAIDNIIELKFKKFTKQSISFNSKNIVSINILCHYEFFESQVEPPSNT